MIADDMQGKVELVFSNELSEQFRTFRIQFIREHLFQILKLSLQFLQRSILISHL